MLGVTVAVYFFQQGIIELPEVVPTTLATATQQLSAVCKEAEQMVQKGHVTPAKMPTIISAERLTEPGVYDDMILVYGYSDNYAAAGEIAEYASRKHKRDFRFTAVQP